MTPAALRPLPGRDPAVERITKRVLAAMDAVVVRLGAAYAEEVPEYAAIGPDLLAAQVLPTSRRIVANFFEALVDGRDPDAADIPELSETGKRRLEMGIPLEPMLHVYRIAGRVVWNEVVAVTQAGEESALGELGARWMDYMDRAASLAAAGYLAAATERVRMLDARRRALLDAVLSARDTAEVAAVSLQFATVLAPAYVPVVVDGDGVHGRIDAILTAAPDGAVGGFRRGRVLVLVPGPHADLNPISRAAGKAVVTWGSPAAPGPELLREVGHAEELLSAARSAGRTQGAFGPDDLLVEQLLASSPRITDTLRRRVLDALVGRDHDGLITSTLRTYLRCGSIPETARIEVVHPNTVLYRLNRVKALTGLDPRVPVEAAVLVLVLDPSGASQ